MNWYTIKLTESYTALLRELEKRMADGKGGPTVYEKIELSHYEFILGM